MGSSVKNAENNCETFWGQSHKLFYALGHISETLPEALSNTLI
jgi:hypothetical protein